jgi:hypothetical protein
MTAPKSLGVRISSVCTSAMHLSQDIENLSIDFSGGELREEIHEVGGQGVRRRHCSLGEFPNGAEALGQVVAVGHGAA